jgi:hypothetical protein
MAELDQVVQQLLAQGRQATASIAAVPTCVVGDVPTRVVGVLARLGLVALLQRAETTTAAALPRAGGSEPCAAVRAGADQASSDGRYCRRCRTTWPGCAPSGAACSWDTSRPRGPFRPRPRPASWTMWPLVVATEAALARRLHYPTTRRGAPEPSQRAAMSEPLSSLNNPERGFRRLLHSLLLCQEGDGDGGVPWSGWGGWRRCQMRRARWRLRQRMASLVLLPSARLRAM